MCQAADTFNRKASSCFLIIIKISRKLCIYTRLQCVQHSNDILISDPDSEKGIGRVSRSTCPPTSPCLYLSPRVENRVGSPCMQIVSH